MPYQESQSLDSKSPIFNYINKAKGFYKLNHTSHKKIKNLMNEISAYVISVQEGSKNYVEQKNKLKHQLHTYLSFIDGYDKQKLETLKELHAIPINEADIRRISIGAGNILVSQGDYALADIPQESFDAIYQYLFLEEILNDRSSENYLRVQAKYEETLKVAREHKKRKSAVETENRDRVKTTQLQVISLLSLEGNYKPDEIPQESLNDCYEYFLCINTGNEPNDEMEEKKKQALTKARAHKKAIEELSQEGSKEKHEEALASDASLKTKQSGDFMPENADKNHVIGFEYERKDMQLALLMQNTFSKPITEYAGKKFTKISLSWNGETVLKGLHLQIFHGILKPYKEIANSSFIAFFNFYSSEKHELLRGHLARMTFALYDISSHIRRDDPNLYDNEAQLEVIKHYLKRALIEMVKDMPWIIISKDILISAMDSPTRDIIEKVPGTDRIRVISPEAQVDIALNRVEKADANAAVANANAAASNANAAAAAARTEALEKTVRKMGTAINALQKTVMVMKLEKTPSVDSHQQEKGYGFFSAENKGIKPTPDLAIEMSETTKLTQPH